MKELIPARSSLQQIHTSTAVDETLSEAAQYNAESHEPETDSKDWAVYTVNSAG